MVVSGNTGQGKTYFAVGLMFKFLDGIENKEDWTHEKKCVVTDLHVIGEEADRHRKEKRLVEINSLEQLAGTENCFVVLDEAQMYLNAQMWKDIPVAITSLMQQHRKRNIELIFIVQNVRRIVNVTRELINRLWEAKRPLERFPFFNRIIVATEYDPESVMWESGDKANENDKKEKKIRTRFMWLHGKPFESWIDIGLWEMWTRWSEAAWNGYNTKQEIGVPKDAKWTKDSSAGDSGRFKKVGEIWKGGDKK